MVIENRKYMTVAQMGEMLGLKKTDSYWLIHKKKFETKKLAGKTVVVISSFERWYENQIKYHKVCGTEPGLRLRKNSYSARDISILLDICEQAAYDLINRAGLKTILIDGWKRVPVEEFERWLGSQSKYRLHDFSEWESEQRKNKEESAQTQADDKEGMRGGAGAPASAERESVSGSLNEGSGMQKDRCRPGRGLPQSKAPDSLYKRKTPPGYLTYPQASVLAGVTGQTIRHWAETGHLSQRKVGNRIYISEEEFKKWLKKREEGGAADGSDHNEERQV